MTSQLLDRPSASSAEGSLVGSEVPRIWTRPLRELTPETSLGYSVIEFSEKFLFIELFPWQKWLLIHALELRPNGRLRFRNIIVLVARQNGKSTLSIVLSLWAMYVLGIKTILGTAQDLDTAEEIWQTAVDLVYELDDDTDEPVRPELFKLARKDPIRVNGKKAFVLRTGERYKVKAANRKAGRGLTGDLILMDELREQQNWDAWGAITKTTMARPNAQVWAMSNAGDVTSVVLRYLRAKAHAPLGDPDDLRNDQQLAMFANEDAVKIDPAKNDLAIFEWSAPPGIDKWDRSGWVLSNPSLGYLIEEDTIASACATDPEHVFRTEVLCQWPDGSISGPFPPGAWEKGYIELSEEELEEGVPGPDKRLQFPVWAAVDVSGDRSQASICIAGYREDGAVQVELAAQRAGTQWIRSWLAERAGSLIGVTGQTNGAPISKLLEQLTLDHERGEDEEDYFPVPVTPWRNADLTGASGIVFDAIRRNLIAHHRQASLDRAAAMAITKKSGDTWLFDRLNSPVDISPLIAFTAAYWALTEREAPEAVSEYETGRLEVI